MNLFEVFHTSLRSICDQKMRSKTLKHLGMFPRESMEGFHHLKSLKSEIDLMYCYILFPHLYFSKQETKITHTHYRNMIAIYIQGFLQGILPFANPLRSRWNLETTKKTLGENSIDSEERTKERRYTSREISLSIAVIKRRTKGKHHRGISMLDISPSWYLYHDTSPIEKKEISHWLKISMFRYCHYHNHWFYVTCTPGLEIGPLFNGPTRPRAGRKFR